MSAAPNYGLDWFEGAISRPDLVLLDFAAAVRPSEYPVSASTDAIKPWKSRTLLQAAPLKRGLPCKLGIAAPQPHRCKAASRLASCLPVLRLLGPEFSA